MLTKNLCRVCNKEIRFWITICDDCRDKRNYYAAKVSINKKRLKKTLTVKKLTEDWLKRVAIQSNNILENWNLERLFI
jgi:predicted amidophosphoribosyltransferase